MKLTSAPRQTSFYESFSDLIFGTLVLFIVVILALALKLRSVADAEVDLEDIIDPYLVAGGADELSSAYCVFTTPDGPRIAFVPQAIAAPWTHFRFDGPGNPVAALADAFSDPNGLLIMSESEFVAFSKGVHRSFMKDSVNYPSMGAALFLLSSMRGEDPAGFNAKSAQALADELGGYRFPSKISPGLRARYDDYVRWFRSYDDGNGTGGLVSSGRDAMFAEGKLRLRFGTLEDGSVTVGGHTCTPASFESFVRSVRPNKEFVLEYCDDAGIPKAAPRSVRAGLLTRLGYDRRVLSEEGAEEVERRRKERG